MEKVSLYKFTYTYLLKNDGQLKQKSDQKKKKKQSPNLLKNKNHVPKKKNHVQLNKKEEKQNKYHTHGPGNPKKLKRKKKKGNVQERKRKRKKEQAMHNNPRKLKKKKKKDILPMCKCTWAFSSIKQPHFILSIFSPFQGENFGEKIPRSHYLFSFLPTQLNTL